MKSELTIKSRAGKNLAHSIRLIAFTLFIVIGLSAHTVTGQKTSDTRLSQWETLADTLMAQERYPEAVKQLTRIIESSGLVDKSDYGALYKRAICYYYMGEQNELALADLNKFIGMFPAVPQVRLLRALVYREMDDAEKQLEDLQFAIGYMPDDPQLLKWRAGLWLDKDEYEKAMQDAQKSIALQDDPEAEAYLAFAYYNLSKPDSALLALNKAIDLDYTYVSAYLYAGSFCLQEGEYELALQYLNLGLRVDDENEALYFYKGAALVELDKIDAGCSCLNKAFYMGYDDASGYIEEYCYKVEDP